MKTIILKNGVDEHIKSIIKMTNINRLDMFVHNPNRPNVNTNGNLFLRTI